MSRSFEQALTETLKTAAPAAPRAGWEQRALEAIARVAPPARARRWTSWRVVVPAGIIVAMLLPAALWLLPHHRSFALARVARATAHAESAHYTGWVLDQSGAREPREGWVEPRRARLTQGETLDEYYDDSRWVMFQMANGQVKVVISPLPDDWAKLVSDGDSYLQQLLFGQLAQQALDRNDGTLAHWERQRLDNGRSVIVADLAFPDGRMSRLTVDERTDLIVRVEAYRRGELVGEIDMEYNVAIPDEVFQYSIPEGATVVDNNAEPNSMLAQGMSPPGEVNLLHAPAGNHGGSCGTWFHKHLRIEFFGPGVAAISYVPKRNSYRVIGKARFIGPGLDVTVEDREYIFPRPPDMTYEQYQAQEARERAEEARRMPPPEVQRWRDEKRNELIAAGAQGYGSFGGKLVQHGYTFDVLNDRIAEVWYLPSKNAFFIMGKVHVHGPGANQVVEDGWAQLTGAPPTARD